jgi:hypothetical protein
MTSDQFGVCVDGIIQSPLKRNQYFANLEEKTIHGVWMVRSRVLSKNRTFFCNFRDMLIIHVAEKV